MSKTRRLERLNSELSAKERALLVLQSWKAGKEEEPGWRFTMPAWQVRDFNRLIGLMNGVNQTLGVYLYAISQEVEKLSLRLGWLITLTLWSMRTTELPTHTAPGPIESELIELHQGALREGIGQRWQQVTAVEVVVDEIAREFDGEDPAVSRVRQSLDHTKLELQAIFEQVTQLGLLEEIELSEPGEEALAEVRELIES